MRLHGSLVEVAGIGVLLSGPSRAGKSECALELVARGHRLVADDAVDVALEAGSLVGRSAPAVRDLLEIRGLGILCVSDLYGPGSVVESTEIGLVCRLVPDLACPDRTGLERETESLLGVSIPRVTLPSHSRGASLATLVDAAARDIRFRRHGRPGAARFDDRLRGEGERA